MHSFPIRSACFASVLIASGCGRNESPRPVVTGVEPAFVSNLIERRIVVSGRNFFNTTSVPLGGGTATVDDDWAVVLRGAGETEIPALRVSATVLEFTLAPNVAPGSYEVVAIAPDGRLAASPVPLVVSTEPVGFTLRLKLLGVDPPTVLLDGGVATAGTEGTLGAYLADETTSPPTFVADIPVTWSQSEDLGFLQAEDGAPSSTSVFRVEDALALPGRVRAVYDGVDVDLAVESGEIDVAPGAVTAVRIETLENGTGTVIPAQVVTTDRNEFSLFAIGRDAFLNATGPANVDWSILGGIGVFTSLTPTDAIVNFRTPGLGTIVINPVLAGIPDASTGDLDVHAGKAKTLSVTPAALVATADDANTDFDVTGMDADANLTTDLGTIVWSNATVTSIDPATGVFSPTMAGSGSVKAQSSHGAAVFDTSPVDVSAGVVASLVLTPSTFATNADAGPSSPFSVLTGRDADMNPTSAIGTITWSIGTGLITDMAPSGVLTPTIAGTGSVRATSSINGATGDSGLVTITPGKAATLVVGPSSLTASADDAATDFDVTSAMDADSNVTTDLGTISWSSNTVTVIDPVTGVFTPAGAGTGSVTALSSHGAGVTTTVPVTVSVGAVASLQITPPTATVDVDGPSQSFSATARDLDGNVIDSPPPALSWSTLGPITLIDSTGLLDPQIAGTGRVRVASGLVSSSSGTVTVTVGAAQTVEISPDTPPGNLNADDLVPFAFSATARDLHANVTDDHDPFVWSSDLAISLIDSSGRLNPTKAGTGRVRVDAGPSLFDLSGSFTIDPGKAATFELNPPSLTTTVGAVTGFTAFARDADGNVTADEGGRFWNVTGGIGTIDPSGAFTATTAGVGTVRLDSMAYAGFGVSPVTVTGSSGSSATFTITNFDVDSTISSDHAYTRVAVTVSNGSPGFVSLTGTTLTFLQGAGVVAGYTVIGDAGNVQEIPSGGIATLTYWVKSIAAPLGVTDVEVLVDGYLRATSAFASATALRTWNVVSTAEPILSGVGHDPKTLCSDLGVLQRTIGFSLDPIAGSIAYDWRVEGGIPALFTTTAGTVEFPSPGTFPYRVSARDTTTGLADHAATGAGSFDAGALAEPVYVGEAAAQHPTGPVSMTFVPTAVFDPDLIGGVVATNGLDNLACDGGSVAAAVSHFTVFTDRAVITNADSRNSPSESGVQVDLVARRLPNITFGNLLPILDGRGTLSIEHRRSDGVVTAGTLVDYKLQGESEQPYVLDSFPEVDCEGGAGCVRQGAPWRFRMSEPIASASVNAATVRVEKVSTCDQVTGGLLISPTSSITYDPKGIERTIRVTPAPTNIGDLIRVRITSNVQDRALAPNTAIETVRCARLSMSPVSVSLDPSVIITSDPFSPDGDVVEDTTQFLVNGGSSARFIKVDIFRGQRRIVTLTDVTATGDGQLAWDGRDSGGRIVQNGFYRWEASSETEDGAQTPPVAGVIEVRAAIKSTGPQRDL